MIPAEARPRLAPKARLRFDRHTDRYLLLYPEKGLELNATAAEIVRLCTGQHTLAELVERLVSAYPSQPRTALERETFAFLTALEHRGLLRYEA